MEIWYKKEKSKRPDGLNTVLCGTSRVRVLGQGMMWATISAKSSSIALPGAPFSAAASAINFGISTGPDSPLAPFKLKKLWHPAEPELSGLFP